MTIGGSTRAYAGGQTSITADRLDVLATDDSDVDPSTAVYGVGGVTGTGAKSTTRISRVTEAFVAAGGNVAVSGGPVNIIAHSDADATANATSAAVSLAIHGPTWCNMHPQYSRSLDPEASHDILIQENHGNQADVRGSITRLVGGEGADIHVIRDDGSNFRNLP